MKRFTRFVFLQVAVLVAVAASSMAQPPAARIGKAYRNPIIDRIGPADPHVIRHEGKYYLYPTTDGKGYDVFVSAESSAPATTASSPGRTVSSG